MTERQATLEDRNADLTTLSGRLRRAAWRVQQTTVGVAGGNEHELTREILACADEAAAQRKLLTEAKKWIIEIDDLWSLYAGESYHGDVDLEDFQKRLNSHLAFLAPTS